MGGGWAGAVMRGVREMVNLWHGLLPVTDLLDDEGILPNGRLFFTTKSRILLSS